MTENKTALILSAHAADFVWRCGGAIALHEKLGYKVTIDTILKKCKTLRNYFTQH